MVFASVPFQQVHAQTAYKEEFTSYLAGSSALWWMSFSGINGSTKLSAVEAIPGVTSYNVTAIKTSNWVSDFQVFGPNGYDLIPVPFIPNEGLFLTVGADTFGDAAAAAGAFDSYLLSSFVSISNGSGSYQFYSPLSFTAVMPKTLMRLVPTAAGGFASAFTSSSFLTLQSQILIVSGEKTPSGFDRAIALGSTTNKALDNLNSPNLLNFFASSNTTIGASRLSTSSVIHFKFLDGVVSSRDNATIVNHMSPFSGDYTLNLAPGQRVLKLNATVLQQPAELLATRVIDTGVLNPGQNVSVSITLRNLSNTTALENITLVDDWWVGLGFTLVSGNSTIHHLELTAGSSNTPTYILQYNGNSTQLVTIPRGVVRYSYSAGGFSHDGAAVLNPIRLSLGISYPIIFATVAPTGSYGFPVGGEYTLRIALRNVGTQTASSVTVGGQSISGIIPGGSASVPVTQASAGLVMANLSRSFAVTYKNPQGASLNASTNVMPMVFSHASMKVGFPLLAVGVAVSSMPNGTDKNLTLTFTTSNSGTGNVTSFSARGMMPTGLGCGVVSGTGASCSGGVFSLSYQTLVRQATQKAYMKFNLTSPSNLIIPPVVFNATNAASEFSGGSNAAAVPAGFIITKVFSPDQLFPGMSSTVTVNAMNSGPFRIFNATASTGADIFDKVTGAATTTGSKSVMSPGQGINFSYGVKTTPSSGDLIASSVTASLFFGGRQFSVTEKGPMISVYEPVGVTITTSPSSPSEGRSFTMVFTLKNPSKVNVSNVLFTLPLPSGLSVSQSLNSTISNEMIMIAVPSLPQGGSYVASADAVASSGIAVPFAKGNLTFTFAGVGVQGKVRPQGFVVGENVTLRYLIPTGVAFVFLLATAYYLRRLAAPTLPTSQK